MSEELQAGTRVGRYQLLFRLGKGGMGEVWAASQRVSELGFEKLIALKVLKTSEIHSNAAIMFFDEAKAASALQHASIVPTVDLGREGDVLFIAMDLVRGPSLTALLQKLVLNKTAMSPAVVAYIGTHIASALDYAHDRAIFEGQALKLIHRDISPHNVLLDLNGAVRLMDFGVARTAIQRHESQVGTVRGKPSYMAPEQVIGGEIDARTDLFSLGIVLYESACLKRLFGRSNPVKSMDAVLKHAPKPLLELVPDFPPALWEVIERALRKEPAERFQTAKEMNDALLRVGKTIPGFSQASRELCALIQKNFPSDAFDVDSRVREARETFGEELPLEEEAQPETSADRPARGLRTFVGGLGTKVAWPTAAAPDPLAPEAIEEARTRFAAVTPSGLQVAAMSSLPSMESMTPFGVTGASIPAAPARSNHLVIGLLCAAAAALLATTFVVVRARNQAALAVAQVVEAEQSVESPNTPTVTVRKPVMEPPPPPPPSEARREPPAEPEKPKKSAAAAPAPRREDEPGRAESRAAEANASREEVLKLIRQVKQVDQKAASEMIPTLNEAGHDNQAVLNELRSRARSILAAAQK